MAASRRHPVLASVSDLRHRSHDCGVGDVVCTLTNRTGSAPLSKRIVPAGMFDALDANSASAGCRNGVAGRHCFHLPDLFRFLRLF